MFKIINLCFISLLVFMKKIQLFTNFGQVFELSGTEPRLHGGAVSRVVTSQQEGCWFEF